MQSTSKCSAPDQSSEKTERTERIKNLIAAFGDQRLHPSYTGFAQRLCKDVATSGLLNIGRGRVEIWAAALVYAIARLNFLFSREIENHLVPDELCDWFGVVKSTTGNKASAITDAMRISMADERYCGPHITRFSRFIEDEHGFILPVVPRLSNGDEGTQPPPLKPSAWQAARAAENPPKTKSEPEPTDPPTAKKQDLPKEESRQLSLFGD